MKKILMFIVISISLVSCGPEIDCTPNDYNSCRFHTHYVWEKSPNPHVYGNLVRTFELESCPYVSGGVDCYGNRVYNLMYDGCVLYSSYTPIWWTHK